MRLSRSLLFIPSFLLLTACTGGTGIPVKRIWLKFHDQFESRVPEFDGQLQRPVACDIDEDGYIYVLDEMKHHVVVFDNDMVAVRTIGREGWGKGEMKLHVGSNVCNLVVDGGLVAVYGGNRTIFLFRTDGTWVNRLETDRTIWDMTVLGSERIVVTCLDEDFPIMEYDLEGNVQAAYGRTFIDYSLDSTGVLKRHSWCIEGAAVGALKDGQVVTFGEQWPRLRFYSEGEMTSEADLDLMAFFNFVGKKDREMLMEMVDYLQEHSPEKIEELARSGRAFESVGDSIFLAADLEMAVPNMQLAMDFKTAGDQVWGLWGPLFQMEQSGRVLRIFRVRAYAQADFAVGAGKAVFCDTHDRTIAVGRLPNTR